MPFAIDTMPNKFALMVWEINYIIQYIVGFQIDINSLAEYNNKSTIYSNLHLL